MVRSITAVLVLGVVGLLLVARADPPQPALNVHNLDRLNTDHDEDEPHLSSDGLRLYYTSNASGKDDILVAGRPVRRQPWPRGQLVEGYVQTAGDDRSAFVTHEGRYPQYLYFGTKKERQETANFDIYVAVKQGREADFSAPTPVHAVCSRDDELHPWLTADGRQLYFSRKTAAGWRVFVAARDKGLGAAGFGVPRPVDLPPGFHHATLSPDGRMMYLQGPLNGNRWGLFRATRSRAGWGTPEPLTALNRPDAPTGDRSPSLSRDGIILYFASDRPGGKGGLDIWWVLTEELDRRAR